MTKFLVLSALAMTVSGCFRMQIQNAARPEVNNFEQGEWHHTGVIGLVEFSQPVNLQKECAGSQWQTVQIQETFVQGLVHAITWGLYTPWDVNMRCKSAT